MAEIRTIKRVLKGEQKVDGAGVSLIRVFGYHDTDEFDPFLMLDAFDSYNPNDYTKGFPWHPHRGIETITYLIEGKIEHGDSLGNSGVIDSGDCQWMTAGSGIMHQEMPKESRRMLGFQLWANLPAKYKMTEPKYRDIKAPEIPVIEGEAKIHLVAGKYKGVTGPVEGVYIDPIFMDVELKGSGEFTLGTQNDHTMFTYIIGGKGSFGDSSEFIPEKSAVLFNNGDKFTAKASPEGMRFIIVIGKPIKEPVAWGGPIVMNTKEELKRAFEEIKEGTFIKHKK
jgi:quercetin 2,3-dioxygenase